MSFTVPAPPTAPIVPGEVRYLVEMVEGSTYTGRAVELPNCTQLSGSESASISVTFTAGGVVREISAPTASPTFRGPPKPSQQHGIRQRTWRASGLSGKRHRLGTDRAGNSLYASGPDLFAELRAFFDQYAAQLATWQAQYWHLPPPLRPDTQPALVLRMLAEGEEYLVEVSTQPMRTVDLGPMWQYAIDLTSYAPAPAPQLDALSSIFGTIAGIAKQATAFIDSATAWVAYSRAVTQGATATVAQFLGPIAAVGRLAEETSLLALAGKTALGLPRRLVESTFAAADQGVDALEQIADVVTFGALDEETDAFRRQASANMNSARMQALETLGVAGLALQAQPGDGQPVGSQGGSLIQAVPTVTTVAVVQGDSLSAIALRTGVTASEIMALNDMPDPYTLSNGAPLTPGAQLVVPNTQGLQALSAANLYGSDLALQPVPNSATQLLDLVTVGAEPSDWSFLDGQAAFHQALNLRGLTEQRDFQLFPTYGLNLRLGERNIDVTRGALAADTRRQFLQDPRVATVGPIDIAIDGGDYRLDVPIYPKAGNGVLVPVSVT